MYCSYSYNIIFYSVYLAYDTLCFLFLLRVYITTTTHAINPIITTAMITPTIAGMRLEFEDDDVLAIDEGSSSNTSAINGKICS